MTTDQTTTRTITTDGITITAVPDTTNLYTVTGSRIAGTVDARLSLGTETEWRAVYGSQLNERVKVEVPVTTTWFGSRTDPDNPPIQINDSLYVGHYAMTASGRYVGSNIARLDGRGKVTDNARAILHAIGAAVATLHATPDRIRAAKIQAADDAVDSAVRALTEAKEAYRAAFIARAALEV